MLNKVFNDYDPNLVDFYNKKATGKNRIQKLHDHQREAIISCGIPRNDLKTIF